MSSVADWSRWWNLLFILPFGVGALLAFASVLGTGRRGCKRAAAKTVGGRVAVSSSRSVAAHGKAPMRSQAQRGPRHKQARQTRGIAEALHLQNIPPVMLVQNFLLFWGVLGWGANQVFAPLFLDPARFILPALLTAGAGGLVLTLGIGTALSRFAPQDESFVVTRRDLEGRAGEAIANISEKMGSAHVRDYAGTLHQLPVRVQPGGEPIPRGQQVLIIEYQPEGDFYWVRRWSPED